MIKVQVLSIVAGPQEEEEFEAHGSPMYPLAWMCNVRYDNGAEEQAKITVNGRSRSGGYCKKFVAQGCYICAENRTMYNDTPQIKVETKATKLANGEEPYKPSEGGGGPQAPATGSAGPAPKVSGGCTMEGLAALLNACYNCARSIVDGDATSEALQAASATLFIACRQEGVKAPKTMPAPPAAGGGMPPAGNNAAMQEVLDNAPPPPPPGSGDDSDENLPF